MARKEEIRFQATGNLDKELEKIAKSTEKTADAMDDLGKKTDEAAKKVAASVDDAGKSVKDLAKEFLTLELAKQVLEKTVAFLSEAVKKYKEAEVAAGGTLDEIAKKSKALSREMDNLTIAVGKFSTKLQESALTGGESDSLITDLTSLIDKASDYSDEIIQLGKSAAESTVNMMPFGTQLTALAGIFPTVVGYIDDMTGSTDALIESTKKITKEFKKAYDPTSSMYSLYEAGYKEYSKKQHFQFDSPYGLGVKPPEDGKGNKKGKARKEESLLDLVSKTPKGEEARKLADQLAADQAKRDAEQAEIQYLERRASLLIEGNQYEAELLEIQREQLPPMQERLRLQEADVREKERQAQAQDELKRKEAEYNAVEAKKITDKGAEAQQYTEWANTVASSLGFAEQAQIAKAAIDGAVYQYQALALSTFNPAGASQMQSAAIGAFIVAGTSAIGGILGLGGNAKPKKAAPSGATKTRTGQNAREAQQSSVRDTPSTTVYNVDFRSLTTPTPKEARAIASALNLDARSRV